MTYVLVASDKFKGSLTAAAVGEAVSAGIRGVYPNTEVVVAPVADGGGGNPRRRHRRRVSSSSGDGERPDP